MVLLKMSEIRELIRLLDETTIAELNLETEDMKLLLKKAEPAVVHALPQVTYMPAQASGTLPSHVDIAVRSSADVPSQGGTVAPESPSAGADSLHTVLSPMVGTFYRSPAPDSPSYVEVGTAVSGKSVVCIIEAMKLMNEIEAEVSGQVVEILVENGQLVEYGQPLFRIKRS